MTITPGHNANTFLRGEVLYRGEWLVKDGPPPIARRAYIRVSEFDEYTEGELQALLLASEYYVEYDANTTGLGWLQSERPTFKTDELPLHTKPPESLV